MKLNPEQTRAAEHQGSHLLVLAGAGTGKTRTIIARAAFLMAQGVDASRILALTFTRKAASEMISRLKNQVGPAADGIRAGTFHAFCLHTMKHYPKAFGLDRMTVLDRDDQLELLGMIRGSLISKQDLRFPNTKEIAELMSYSRNTNIHFEEYLRKNNYTEATQVNQIMRVYQGYEARKRLRQYVDYDDLLYLFARALHSPSMDDLRRRIAGQYDHILVDEMQDTNPIQWLILDGLRDPAMLYCVGDDAQSIYSFRGADFKNVHSFKERVRNSHVVPLLTNYRSTQPILDLANWLLEQSRKVNYDKKLVAHRGGGTKPQFIEFDSSAEEANWIATDIVQRVNEGTKLNEIMVLVRAAWLARDLEAALASKGVEYVFIGGTKLMEAAHVKDLLAMVRAAVSPTDELGWSRFLRLFNRVGEVTANAAIDQISVLKSPGEVIEKLPVILRFAGTIPDADLIVQALKNVVAAGPSPAKMIEECVKTLDPIQKKRHPDWKKRSQDYNLLVTLAKKHRSVEAFLDTYTLDPVSATVDSKTKNKDALTMITVHSAKGTESKICYIMKVQPGVYPYSYSLDDLDSIEEERRILYVAMTRAKDELILTRVGDKFGTPIFFGGSRGAVPHGGTADFFEEIPATLVDYEMKGFKPSPFENEGPIIPRFRPEDN